MATEEEGKGDAPRQPLPFPATTAEMYLAAILDELTRSREIVQRCDERLTELLVPTNSEPNGTGIPGDDGGTEISLAPARQAAQKGRK